MIYLPIIQKNNKTEDISARINKISTSLQESSSELSSIQKELEERIKFVDTLKEEAEIAENVLSLSEDQVNAVQAKLNKELETNSNRGLLQNTLITFILSLFFYVLGFVTSNIRKLFKKRIRQLEENPQEHDTEKPEDILKQIYELTKKYESQIQDNQSDSKKNPNNT